MPYRAEGNRTVKVTTGETVPGGTHDSHAEAVAQAQAMNIAMHKEGEKADMKSEGAYPEVDEADFVFPDTRSFPIRNASDVGDAVSSWGRYKGAHSFEDFKQRLSALARRKGYAGSLPKEWTDSSNDNQKGVTPDVNNRPVIRVFANPFGGPNNGKDAQGQFFSPRTQFHEDRLPLPPAVYYHGYNPDGTPAGVPDFIGPTIGRGVDPQRGVWYDVALDTQKSDGARRLAATPSEQLRASAGVVPATKRIAPNGEILSWMNGEISVFDANATRRPVNDYAVGTHIKALYQKAGLDTNALNTAATGSSMNPLDVLMTMISAWWASMNGGNGANGAGAAATASDMKPDAAGEDKAKKDTSMPVTPAPVPVPAPAPDPLTPTAAAPAMNAMAPAAAPAAASVAPNDLHIHYHAPDQSAGQLGGVPPVPDHKDNKEMTNQKDDSMKAQNMGNDNLKAQVDALTAALTGRVRNEAEGWAMDLMKSGKMLPVEKPHAVETYVALTLESENMKSLAPALEHFKLAYTQRESNGLIGDPAQAGLQGAGFAAPDNQKAEKPMSTERRTQLLGSSLIGQAVLREQGGK